MQTPLWQLIMRKDVESRLLVSRASFQCAAPDLLLVLNLEALQTQTIVVWYLACIGNNIPDSLRRTLLLLQTTQESLQLRGKTCDQLSVSRADGPAPGSKSA